MDFPCHLTTTEGTYRAIWFEEESQGEEGRCYSLLVPQQQW